MEALALSAVVVLYATRDGKVRSWIRLGGVESISREDSLGLLAQAVSVAMEKVSEG